MTTENSRAPDSEHGQGPSRPVNNYHFKCLLTPRHPPNEGSRGLPPHHRYELIRSRALEIVRARDDQAQNWSDTKAARQLGFRSGREFALAYELLKDNGKRLVDHDDWSGVEATIYARFPGYEDDPKFLGLLFSFGDVRVLPGGRLFGAPMNADEHREHSNR